MICYNFTCPLYPKNVHYIQRMAIALAMKRVKRFTQNQSL